MALNQNSNNPAWEINDSEDSVSVTIHKTGTRVQRDYDVETQAESQRSSQVAPFHAGQHAKDKISVGKQVELEAENAIKYRTCSWQKVRLAQCLPD
jgi:hypothetical protein